MSTKKRKSSSDGDGRPDAQKKAKCDAGAKDKGKGKKGGGGASVETKGVGRCGSGAGAGVEGLDVTVKGKGKRGVGGAAEAGSGSGGLDVTVEEHTRAVELLRGVQWERVRNTSRRNVLREEKFCMSFIFGRNMKDPDGGLSYWSLQYPELYAFFSALMQRVHPQHPFTNITVNKNLQCKRHTDGGNTGPRYFIPY
ncbi:hypothetical protein B484DRAFT_405269 [Ochromonadaceae sp. CCMP2298]|nr:hypothetical protein B484DRAFT_405269 [Ochromonadaceae sp. CCMP2298]